MFISTLQVHLIDVGQQQRTPGLLDVGNARDDVTGVRPLAVPIPGAEQCVRSGLKSRTMFAIQMFQVDTPERCCNPQSDVLVTSRPP